MVRINRTIPVVGLAIALVGHSGCDQYRIQRVSDNAGSVRANTDAKPVLDIEVGTIGRGNYFDRAELPATVEADEQTHLMPRVEGYVGEVFVDIGDEVTRGQVLATLDVPEMEAERLRKEKLVAKAKADRNSQRAEVVRAQSQVAEHKALLQMRDAELNRISKLVDAGALKREKLDEVQYALDAARAALERADADIEAAEAHELSAEAAVGVAEAELAKTEAMVSYLEIRAPFDGVITERSVDPGAFVRPVTSGGGIKPLLSIATIDRLRVVIMVPIEDASKLDVGDAVVLHGIRGVPVMKLQQLQSTEGGSLHVSRHAKTYHQGSRMMRAEIDIDNPTDPESGKRVLKAGDYGKLTITLAEYKQAPFITGNAVGEDSRGTFVVLVNDSNICSHQVVEVAMVDDTAVILGGAQIGDRVIVKGRELVKDGQQLP